MNLTPAYRFYLFLILLLVGHNLHAQELKPKFKKGYYGFSLNGEMVVDYQFDTVRNLPDERFLVSKDGLLGVVSPDETEMIPCEYECLITLPGNRYLVSNNELFGVIDSSGGILWDIIYDEIDHVEGDTIGLVKLDGKWAISHHGVFNYNQDEFYFENPDIMPLFPGCKPFMEHELYKYIYTQIRYPDVPLRGNVILEFIIDKNGSVLNSKVIQGLRKDIDKECLRVVSNMPQWQPGVEDDEKINTRYFLRIAYGMRINN